MSTTGEVDRIRQRYARRRQEGVAERYRPIREAPLAARQERERALARLFRELEQRLGPVERLRVLEIGCGTGDNLLELIRLGFDPGNLAGNELLADSLATARLRLPDEVSLWGGDARELDFEPERFDIVYQSTVFTSVLDREFRQELAEACWSWVRPGGGLLWYDFAWDNPNNPDVAGIKAREIRKLFPAAQMRLRKLTLAPPLSRAAVRISPKMYPVLNAFPFLRSHLLAWLAKPEKPEH